MTTTENSPAPSTPRQRADQYVQDMADADPSIATSLGLRPHDDRMPDFSPAAQQQRDDLARAVLADLDAMEAAAGPDGWDAGERRCATLLRDRLGIAMEASEAGEHLRTIRNISAPAQQARSIFSMMPAQTEDDWACIARRMARLPDSYASYVLALEEGKRQVSSRRRCRPRQWCSSSTNG